jgi:carboxyl-terminal processing protease
MGTSRASSAPWVALVTVIAIGALGVAPQAPAGAAPAADASLTVAALHVLEKGYVARVHSAQLLNAAVATLQKATHLGTRDLLGIPATASESGAIAVFDKDFARAVQSHAMPQTQLAYLATAGMLASLHDSHVFFLPPAALQEAQKELKGQPGFTGIGVVIVSLKDPSGTAWIFVDDVLPGSPAQAAGLERFDRIADVNGKSLRNANPLQAAKLLRGPVGSRAKLTVLRKSQTLHVTVTRAPITVPPVAARFVQPGVAYLRVFEFAKGTGTGLRSDIQHLASQHPIQKAILDLRGNPGGLIMEATSTLSLFLPKGTVVAQDERRGQPLSLIKTAGTPMLSHTPLVLLINGGSASGSELVAAALKDYGRATLVGEKTAGALGGAVIAPLPFGCGMSVTVERIYSPHHQTVEGVGVTPNVTVALTAADMEQDKDTQLQAAIRVLSGMRVHADHGPAPAARAIASLPGAPTRADPWTRNGALWRAVHLTDGARA